MICKSIDFFHLLLNGSEHRITRGFAGFWTENRKLFHVSSSEVPFQVTNKDIGIEVIDPLSAEILGSYFNTFKSTNIGQNN